MLKTSKTIKTLVFTLLTAALLISVIGANISTTKAQTAATVTILTTIGGAISESGTTLIGGLTYNYTTGTPIVFTAVPGSGFIFDGWTYASVSGSFNDGNNPLTIILNDTSYSLEANFTPIEFIVPATIATSPTNAIVVVLAGVGGTTSPTPGTYALANASALQLTATADSGWTFDHWVIAGTPLNHGVYALTLTPTDNPYTVDHGYGNTYSYQPVFSPVSSSTSPTPTPKVSEFSSASAIIIAAILVIAAFGTYAFTRRAKK